MRKRYLIIFLIILTVFLTQGISQEDTGAEFLLRHKLYKLHRRIFDIVKTCYVDEEKVDTKTLLYDSIRGLLKNLDPHTEFLDEELHQEFHLQTKGEYGGLGILITLREGILTVVSPIEGTPAEKAGILPGDKIVEIEGETTKGITLSEAVRKMRGTPGTEITITIAREGLEEPFSVTLTRANIKLKSVPLAFIIKEGIGYIRLANFQPNTAQELKQAIEKLEKEGLSSLILDLRNNGGGLLDQAVEVTQIFLEKGKTVVVTKGRLEEEERMYSQNEYPCQYPLIILINKGSASASEIVAGALKYYGRATLIGTKSFGKGSVQKFFHLTSDTGLKITVGKYYLPSGECIDNKGVLPDIEVTPPEYSRLIYYLIQRDLFRRFAESYALKHKELIDEDKLLNKFKKVLKEKEPTLVEKVIEDKQLIEILKEKKINIFEELFVRNKSRILQLLTSHILKLIKGPEKGPQAAKIYSIQFDPFIQEALKWLKRTSQKKPTKT
jgi:carboxyl-terminal processing protease